MKTRTVQLGEVCEINPATEFDFAPDDTCSFVPMEAVDDVDARIEKSTTRPFREVAKGYTPFAENDVIVAKITPCMENGKCAIARNLRSGVGFGSTEFHVLRATKHVIPEWLFYFWRFPLTRKLAGMNMTGSAGQKRVPANFLETVQIPLPSLSKQQRIAGQLEQADRLRRTRRYALELSATFLPAAFLQLFGETTMKRQRWPEVALGDLIRDGAKINYGVVQPGLDLHQGVPIVRVADLEDLETSLPNLKLIAPEIDEQHSASRLVGDEVLVACVGSIGKVAKALPELKGCNIARAVARIPGDWSRIDRDFLAHYLTTRRVQDYWLNETRTVSQPTLNILQIEQTPVMQPPHPRQQRFAVLVERVERLRSVQRESLRQSEHLFQSLLHHAFTSDLEPSKQ